MKAIPIILAVVVFSATLEIQEPSGADKAKMRTTENRVRYVPGRTEIVEHTITKQVAQDPPRC